MQAMFAALFEPSAFSPHGFCLLWDPGLIWLHALSDAVIGLCYFSIPLALLHFARRRPDLEFRWILWLFALFILACGSTHFMAVATLWVPLYWIDGIVKLITALASIATAILLWPLLPRLLALPSPSALRLVNDQLSRQMEEREGNLAILQEHEALLRQSQKMEAVGQLTGGIAHDFNNMLQAIGGSLEMMERRIGQGRSSEAEQFVDTARKTVERAAALTHRLLAFARRQPLQPRSVEPDELIAGMEELIRRTMGPGVTIELRMNDGVWTVLCDPNQLENVLLNLTINARDAMPDGGRLTIATNDVTLSEADVVGQEGARPGAYVEISVIDTGTGMDATTKARAFEPFFTTKPIGQGTGLGLSQLYGFVRQSGGIVRLDSAPGQGTTVRLYLPRHADADEPETKAAGSGQGAASQSGAGETVLLVEDETNVRMVAAEALRDFGYRVLEAADGPAALQVLHSAVRVDLMVTDVGLPGGLNGRQVADAARERRPVLPVLFITGYAGHALEGQLAPGMEVIGKPFALDVLAARVRAMLEARPATIPLPPHG